VPGHGVDGGQRGVRRTPPGRCRRCGEGPHASAGVDRQGLGSDGRPTAGELQRGPPRLAGVPVELGDELLRRRLEGGESGTRGGGARAAAEQQPVERRRWGRSWSAPTSDDLRLGAGQRDVEQAQPSPASSARARAAWSAQVGPARRRCGSGLRRRRGRARRSGSRARSGPRRRGGRRRGTAGPCWRGSSRAAPRRRRSRGGGCAPRAASGRSRRSARGARSSSATRPSRSARDLVEHLADVAQVGEQAFAADLGQHPRGSPPTSRRLQHRGHAAAGEQLEPRPERLGDLVGQRRRRRRRARRRCGRRSRSAPPTARAGLRCGCSSASSSVSHSRAAGVAKTLPPPAITAGTPTSEQRRLGGGEVACGSEHRDVAGPIGRPSKVAPEVEQPRRRGRGRAMSRRTWATDGSGGRRSAELCGAPAAQPERAAGRRPAGCRGGAPRRRGPRSAGRRARRRRAAGARRAGRRRCASWCRAWPGWWRCRRPRGRSTTSPPRKA
jgi:hypothetical protein